MEWAVGRGADVVSMSLGSTEQTTTCDDPLALAVDSLSASSDSLFVIAAGNSGSADNTVSSPGCAPAVLTVGAVDRDDETAVFSSRGPVNGTHVLKPEIAAPGVDISAAAAGGRGVYAYQTMSGTSMATPHVAGAAAIVKERHPGWTGEQIKAALVASADSDIPGDVRETGSRSSRRRRRHRPAGREHAGPAGRVVRLAPGQVRRGHRAGALHQRLRPVREAEAAGGRGHRQRRLGGQVRRRQARQELGDRGPPARR